MTKASLILIALAMVISSCGNSGRGRPRGQHCPSSYDPISLEQTAEGTQKISLDPKDSQLVEGLYEYAGAEIFYHDSEEDIKIHVKEFVGADGKTTPGNVCVRGLKQKMELITAVYGMDSMAVDPGGKTDFSVRRFQLTFKDSLLVHDFVEPTDEQKPSSPSKLYKSKASDYSFYRLKDEAQFELRSVSTVGPIRQFLLIRYRLKDNP